MRFQVYLFIFGSIGGYLHPVRCDTNSDINNEEPDDIMKLMENDMLAIAPSLLRSPAGLNNQARWPGNVIPYQFQRGYPQDLRNLFQRAAQHISERTCIRFAPRTNQRDYIHVIQDNGCYSSVGRLGRGGQRMSLPRGCAQLGVFVHEMLHAVGYDHEQNRFDRDNYVAIQWNNIQPGRQDQFYRNRMRLRSQYDYQSVMHYSRKAFSRNGRDTIVPRRRGVTTLGQSEGMSRGDIDEVNANFCS